MNIAIVMPDNAAARSGNQHTALRWAHFLRQLGHRVTLASAWQGDNDDMLIALHARKSHASAAAFHHGFPHRPLVVVLTGTDLYRDIHVDAEAKHSLEIATRLVVLQEQGRIELAPRLRRKTRIIYQSADVDRRSAPVRRTFRLVVIGHLRDEKDPFRAVQAVNLLPQYADLEVVHIGAALSTGMQRQAQAWMRQEPRYRWLGSQPHHRALQWLGSSHLLVVSSAMEGGANVICEAARIGIPVAASKVAGNIGMLGTRYHGCFALHDTAALAGLIARAYSDRSYFQQLTAELKTRRPLFAPAAERASLKKLLAEFG